MKIPAILIAALFASCAALPPVPPAGAPLQQCPVCRHTRDFECLVVKAVPGTPHADYAGRTHYFCGENCRRDFHRDPARYWPAH